MSVEIQLKEALVEIEKLKQERNAAGMRVRKELLPKIVSLEQQRDEALEFCKIADNNCLQLTLERDSLREQLKVANRDAELARSISQHLGLGREIKDWRDVTLALDGEREAAKQCRIENQSHISQIAVMVEALNAVLTGEQTIYQIRQAISQTPLAAKELLERVERMEKCLSMLLDTPYHSVIREALSTTTKPTE